MNLKQFNDKIEIIKLGKSKGLLKYIFGVKVNDNFSFTYGKLKIKKLNTSVNIGDLCFFRMYSKGQAQLKCSVGVVTKVNDNNFEYLTNLKGLNTKRISDYNLIKKNGNCLLGFHTIIKG
jgi:hypothetical protein